MKITENTIILRFPSKPKLKTNMHTPCTNITIPIYNLFSLEVKKNLEGKKNEASFALSYLVISLYM